MRFLFYVAFTILVVVGALSVLSIVTMIYDEVCGTRHDKFLRIVHRMVDVALAATLIGLVITINIIA